MSGQYSGLESLALQFTALESGKAVTPVLGQGCGSAGLRVEVNHDLSAVAFYLACGCVLQSLHHREALVAHVIHLSLHHQRLIKMSLMQKLIWIGVFTIFLAQSNKKFAVLVYTFYLCHKKL